MEYSSGEKNIGIKGRKRRKALAIVLFSAFLFNITAYPERLTTLTGASSSVFLLYGGFYSFIQSEQNFCGTFGFLGLKETPQGLQKIKEKANRLTDLNKSVRQNMYSLGAAVFLYLWVFALAI